MKTILRSLSLLMLLLFAPPSLAEEQDVAAAVRSVVRVVIVATKGNEAYFVGHASGFAVAPDKVLTNAHVVDILKQEPNLVLGIVPSEGKRSYGGKVVAYSPGNDLALIQIPNGTLPVSTFYAGAVTDGQHVTAIGYPGNVDRAQGLSLDQIIQPLSPVKSSGNISTGRSSQSFDTILHTAPMGQGNSGGPLVDDCGRILGANSFGSLSDGNDAEFGFAVSNREVASFLRQAGVQFLRTSAPCRSIADLDAQEAARQQQLKADEEAKLRATDANRQKAWEKIKDAAEQDIISGRENALAIAAILLALAALSAGSSVMLSQKRNRKNAIWAGLGGVILLAGAGAVFFTRPSFSELEDRISQSMPDQPIVSAPGATSQYNALGDNICRIDMDRSRITVSDTADVPLTWTESGCVNGAAQYGRDANGWSRIFVPNNDPSISINSFDPATGTYRTERYLADADTLDKARELRSKYTFAGCTADEAMIVRLQDMQGEIRSILPPQPNERLVYNCSKASTEDIAALKSR